jgi:glycine/D-amino acid oxidase-like deaminating enzyme
VRATGILSSGGRISGVLTSEGDIATAIVVVAAGPWAEGVASWAGATLPVKSCRTQVALVRRPCDFGGPHPVVCDLGNQLYLRPTHGEMTHVGNIDPREENAVVDADSYSEVADAAFVQEVRQKFERRYPALRRGWGRGGYGALYAITPDWRPIVDRLPGIEGAFCAAGFSGHGFKMAPAVGQIVSELVVAGRTTSFDIGALRADRFAAGNTLQAKSAYKVMG